MVELFFDMIQDNYNRDDGALASREVINNLDFKVTFHSRLLAKGQAFVDIMLTSADLLFNPPRQWIKQ